MYYIGARAHDYHRQQAESLAASIALSGFSSVQLAPAKALHGIETFDDITDDVLAEARTAFDAAKVRIDVYGCYQEIGSRDPAERRVAVDRFCAGISHAKLVGAPIIATETTGFSGTDEEREQAYIDLREGVILMVRKAELEDVTVCIEPVVLHTLNSARLARRLLDEVDSPQLGIVFDPVNMLTTENLAYQDSIWDEYFELLGQDICAVHLKDVDERLGWRNLGHGLVHYEHIFAKLKTLNRELPLLREGVIPDSADVDIGAIKRWIMA